MIPIIQSLKTRKSRPGVRNNGPGVKSGLTSVHVNCLIGTQACSFLYALPMFFVCLFVCFVLFFGFLDGRGSKESACNVGDPGLIPGLGRSPEEGNDNPLQYSCLGNSMERGTGGLQCMGLQKVRHNLVTNTLT